MGEEATPQSNSHHSSLMAPIFPDRLRLAGYTAMRAWQLLPLVAAA
jgi:hypothetical protein